MHYKLDSGAAGAYALVAIVIDFNKLRALHFIARWCRNYTMSNHDSIISTLA
jgi:hypothetical protein